MQNEQNTTSFQDIFDRQVKNQWVVARSTASERIARLRRLHDALLRDVPDEAELWSDELFSPLLPFRTYQTPDEAIAFVQQHPRPLFTSSAATNKTSSA